MPDTASSSHPLQQLQARAAGGAELAVSGVTDQGRVRKNNEDNLAACDLSNGEILAGPFEFRRALGPQGVLLLVADGMGGQACGELASQMCSDLTPVRLLDGLRQIQTATRQELGGLLTRALESANQSILETSRNRPACKGMGTTATAALLRGTSVLVAQVGDSRAYLIRNGKMAQLTRDQTFLNYLVEMGAVDAAVEAHDDPRRSILVQALGTSEKLNVVLTEAEVQNGDRLLLASDGLYGPVKADEILEIAGGNADLEDRCRSLVATANRHGGPDNITLILADISGPGAGDPSTPVRVEALTPAKA
ncbi:MAG TPA: protein phosphatase 2C domain-containing protein [Terriglobia bacterium]|nr:protein phosphatase 2C domain-containing protein [Terriglobia bacterium]